MIQRNNIQIRSLCMILFICLLFDSSIQLIYIEITVNRDYNNNTIQDTIRNQAKQNDQTQCETIEAVNYSHIRKASTIE